MSGLLDAHLPTPAHAEVHERLVAASPHAVWQAIHEVTLAELTLTRPLMALRGMPARLGGTRHPLEAVSPAPFLEQFMRAGWGILEERPPERFVGGAIGQPWRLRGGASPPVTSPAQFATFTQPGYVRMALSFEVSSVGGKSWLRTETRVHATDPASARSFARYWIAIRAGSGLIRRDLLRAIARHAEQAR